MMRFLPEKVEKHLRENLLDWSRGGPWQNGWTRTGPVLPVPNLRISGYLISWLHVDEVLAKNREETEKWHLDFLLQYLDPELDFDWKATLYYQEYLRPRYNADQALERARTFLDLYDDIEDHGVVSPVWVAQCDLGFKYFRFNGCHRACCAKIAGIEQVPAFVFTTEAIDAL